MINDLSALILLILRVLLALSLYAFLAWGLVLIWQDIKVQSQQTLTRKAPAIRLRYRLPDENEEESRFNIPEVTVGRDQVCNFHIANETVSSKHARFYFEHKQWWVEDLGSKNGTKLNDNLLLAPTVITKGDLIQCGEAAITLIEIEEQGEAS